MSDKPAYERAMRPIAEELGKLRTALKPLQQTADHQFDQDELVETLTRLRFGSPPISGAREPLFSRFERLTT